MENRFYASLKNYGLAGCTEWISWKSMLARCYYAKHPFFGSYGGRGIVVCERWRRAFVDFLEDMGRKPSSKHTLGRIDNNGPYCKENCRWETRKQQQNNRSNSIFIEIEGIRMALPYWSEKYGVDAALVRNRIKRGWDGKRAIQTPSSRSKRMEMK